MLAAQLGDLGGYTGDFLHEQDWDHDYERDYARGYVRGYEQG
jgi:hypothetical protein